MNRNFRRWLFVIIYYNLTEPFVCFLENSEDFDCTFKYNGLIGQSTVKVGTEWTSFEDLSKNLTVASYYTVFAGQFLLEWYKENLDPLNTRGGYSYGPFAVFSGFRPENMVAGINIIFANEIEPNEPEELRKLAYQFSFLDSNLEELEMFYDPFNEATFITGIAFAHGIQYPCFTIIVSEKIEVEHTLAQIFEFAREMEQNEFAMTKGKKFWLYWKNGEMLGQNCCRIMASGKLKRKC